MTILQLAIRQVRRSQMMRMLLPARSSRPVGGPVSWNR
jgi:hypothetical protein